METVRKLFYKYKDIILYLLFGGCTTLVNVISYWICAHMLSIGVMPSTVIAWILAVLFAYVTNRKWVFHSEANGTNEILGEMAKFFGARIATGIVDWACMYIFVDVLGLNDVIIKILSNIVVIILNYVASKLIIFKKSSR